MRQIKGVFLDIGWTMNAPASGQWFFQPIVKALVGEVQVVPEGCMAFLNENHLVQTEQEEFEQFKVFYRMMFEQLGMGASDEIIEKIAHDKVYNDQNYVFFDDVKPVLLQLKQSHRLGIISDTWPSARRVLKNAGLYELFDAVTLSCELGVYKPHRRMYEHALASLGLPAEQTIFVDDCPECLDGAEALGIRPVLITRQAPPEGHERFVRVNNFNELLQVLP